VERSLSRGVPCLAGTLGVRDIRQMALLEQGIQRFCDAENA